ncbi:hypothetical protein [Maridesulfovibrio sp.]|uniref:hypothetical protein n=1 Tax=Maridesulfovibrio sp. TaxID=2795000 RepID=UPI002A18A752|nr:hypothetical protein [Maridesulfovibrio sp.]
MTTVQTAKDVIEQTKAFHKRLGSFYKELSDKVEKERVKLLLDYMSRHHENLAGIMDEYESGLSEKVLTTWFMYVNKECDLSPFFSADLGPDMTAQQVVQVAVDLDKCLLETYEAMLQNDIPDDVSEVFQGLLDMEKREKIKLAKNALKIETL